MKIKEKAKELAEMYNFEARTNHYCRQCTQQACEMMAHWAFNKAAEWLKTYSYTYYHLNEDEDGFEMVFDQKRMVEQFKKVMEE